MLVLILFALGATAALVAVITVFNLAHLLMSAAQVYWDGAPAWFNTGNFMGWLIALIVLMIASAVLKVVIEIIYAIVLSLFTRPLVKAGLKGSENAILSLKVIAILLVVVAGVAAVILTSQWLSFMSNYSDLSTFFGSPSWVATLGSFFIIVALLNGRSKKSD